MITVGTMQLHQPEAPDAMEPFFVGGEYHTDMSRLSSHDHSGGLLGAPVAVTIPDGSITAADLDPSVLAPYTLTDGSKPFTGTVTMQADAVVRDRLSFGEQGTALAPDAWWERAGVNALRTDSTLGVGVAPAGWDGTARALQVGQSGALYGLAGAGYLFLANNSHLSGGVAKALVAGGGSQFNFNNDGSLAYYTMASVAAGATQTQLKRLEVAATGTLGLSPDAGQAAVAMSTPGGTDRISAAGNVAFSTGNGYVHPLTDNATTLGAPANRWTTVYAISGAVNTSAREAKQDLTPLDPAAALAAVRGTDPVVFDYRPPERSPEWYELPDDPEQAEAILLQRLTAAPLEAGARHQAGFVLHDQSGQYQTDPLFETGEGQSNAANSVGVLLAAIQALDTRLTALETP